MSEQAINFSPVLETFTTETISLSDLVTVGGDLAERMLEDIHDLREHLQTIAVGRFTVGEIRNDRSVYLVKVAALDKDLPHVIRGMRVTNSGTDELESFMLFAEQANGQLLPIDFDIIS